jgi:hypothetical protein
MDGPGSIVRDSYLIFLRVLCQEGTSTKTEAQTTKKSNPVQTPQTTEAAQQVTQSPSA